MSKTLDYIILLVLMLAIAAVTYTQVIPMVKNQLDRATATKPMKVTL